MSDGLFRVFKTIDLVLTLGMSMNAYAGFLGVGGEKYCYMMVELTSLTRYL